MSGPETVDGILSWRTSGTCVTPTLRARIPTLTLRPERNSSVFLFLVT